jgi:hypothetical protein
MQHIKIKNWVELNWIELLYCQYVSVNMLCVLAVDNTLTYSYDYDLEDRDGTVYQVTKNQKTVVEPTKAQYRLTNLFNGDKLLGTCLFINAYNILGIWI